MKYQVRTPDTECMKRKHLKAIQLVARREGFADNLEVGVEFI